jgi:hypothetical protein
MADSSQQHNAGWSAVGKIKIIQTPWELHSEQVRTSETNTEIGKERKLDQSIDQMNWTGRLGMQIRFQIRDE